MYADLNVHRLGSQLQFKSNVVVLRILPGVGTFYPSEIFDCSVIVEIYFIVIWQRFGPCTDKLYADFSFAVIIIIVFRVHLIAGARQVLLHRLANICMIVRL